MKILIPNATGPNNIGDQAILKGLLSVLYIKYNNADITIHSSDEHLYPNSVKEHVDSNLYFWAVFLKKNVLIRIFRLSQLFINYFLIKIHIKKNIGEKRIIKLLNDYKNADIIIFVGGGYFRSKKGITQSLNLIMNLVMFMFAKLFKVKKIIMPISFGPFAYLWQEKLSAYVLNGFDIVSVREKYSYDILHKYNLDKLIISSDTALFIKKEPTKTNKDEIVIGFTVRDWLGGTRQESFENALAQAIINFTKNHQYPIKVRPVVQVNGENYGEFDYETTKRVIKILTNHRVDVLDIITIKDIDSAIKTYSEFSLLIGMRMHSNILSALVGVPFVAISYEHKTEGISRDLGMETYCISCEKVNRDNLYTLMTDAYSKRIELSHKITENLEKIQEKEIKKWLNLL